MTWQVMPLNFVMIIGWIVKNTAQLLIRRDLKPAILAIPFEEVTGGLV